VDAWYIFDVAFLGSAPVDILQFIEVNGTVGIRYPAVNLTAWKS